MDHRSIGAIVFSMSGDMASSPSLFDGGLGGQGWKCGAFSLIFFKSTVKSKENSQ